MSDEKRQHLEFIQNIINRLSSNSFQLKGIVITLTAALLAIYASTPKILLIIICIPQVFFFWLLDSYYLQQERKFRGLYNDAAGLTNINTVAGTPAVAIAEYDMSLEKYKGGKYQLYRSFFSFTKFVFFFSIISILIILVIIIKNQALIKLVIVK